MASVLSPPAYMLKDPFQIDLKPYLRGGQEETIFNMCGYRAPKLDIVRLGFIGIGNRGYSNLNHMTFLEGVQIKAVCDIVQFRIDSVQQLLRKRGGLPEAQVYTGSEDAWKKSM